MLSPNLLQINCLKEHCPPGVGMLLCHGLVGLKALNGSNLLLNISNILSLCNVAKEKKRGRKVNGFPSRLFNKSM